MSRTRFNCCYRSRGSPHHRMSYGLQPGSCRVSDFRCDGLFAAPCALSEIQRRTQFPYPNHNRPGTKSLIPRSVTGFHGRGRNPVRRVSIRISAYALVLWGMFGQLLRLQRRENHARGDFDSVSRLAGNRTSPFWRLSSASGSYPLSCSASSRSSSSIMAGGTWA
jgi:hypothetical protein